MIYFLFIRKLGLDKTLGPKNPVSLEYQKVNTERNKKLAVIGWPQTQGWLNNSSSEMISFL